jgi:hypothetical protein
LKKGRFLRGERACLTSKHSKLKAVARPFERHLGLVVFEDPSIDTDELGTFSGEVERVGPPSDVVIRKAKLGAEKNGVRFGLATEGSFGPHPAIGWVAAHLEIAGFVDLRTGARITESVMSRRTNFASARLKTLGEEEARLFLTRARFPSHALIVRPSEGGGEISKAIQDRDALERAIAKCAALSSDGLALVETDMRAHLNPLRQGVIRAAASRLALRLRMPCPKCDYPGFGMVRKESGLECEDCGEPTRWVKALIYGCAACHHEEPRVREDHKTHAPAKACGSCNP